jgi:hypothetical protein
MGFQRNLLSKLLYSTYIFNSLKYAHWQYQNSNRFCERLKVDFAAEKKSRLLGLSCLLGCSLSTAFVYNSLKWCLLDPPLLRMSIKFTRCIYQLLFKYIH